MSYVVNKSVHPYFSRVFDRFRAAFAALGFELASPSGDGYVMSVNSGRDRPLVFSAQALPLNSAASHTLARDKLAAYQVLGQAGLPVPRGLAFFGEKHRGMSTGVDASLTIRNLNDALHVAFPDLNSEKKFVVKPGGESHGIGVYQCRGVEEVEAVAESVLGYGRYGLVQEFVAGTEYRIALLGDEVLVVYRKHNPAVCADGMSTERELITVYNLQMKAGHPDRDWAIDLENLPPLAGGKVWRLDRVPPEGEVFELAMETYNLSQGAWPEIVSEPPAILVECAKNAQNALGMIYSGVDIIVSEDKNKCTILEINGNPGFSHLQRYEPALVAKIDLAVAREMLRRAEIPMTV